MSKLVLAFLALFAIGAMFVFSGSESEIERKAREEAAINSGRAVSARSGGSDSPAARAAAIEAAAAEPESGLMAPAFQCRPDISAEDCETARKSLASDLTTQSAEKGTACSQAHERLAEDQAQLLALSENLEADLNSLADRISQAQAWIAANCSR
ncbi:MAG: hypothetical protein AB7P31_05275 [Steroidobacteraceae bacterium]